MRRRVFCVPRGYYKEREKPGDHGLDKNGDWQEEMERLQRVAPRVIGKQRHDGPIGTADTKASKDAHPFLATS